MKKYITIIFALIITLNLNSQFEFVGHLDNSSGTALSGFQDSLKYYTVINEKISVLNLSSKVNEDAFNLPANCTIMQLNTKFGDDIGVLVNYGPRNIKSYYLFNKIDQNLKKIVLPDGRNGFVHFKDKINNRYYLVSEGGSTIYVWKKEVNTWDSIASTAYSYSLLYMANSIGVMYEINNSTSEKKLAITRDGGNSYTTLNTINYNAAPFSKSKNGILYELKVITESYWIARYSYDTIGGQVSKVYFTNDQGKTWKIAFHFNVSQFVIAGGTPDVYVSRCKTGRQNCELYKMSDLGNTICKTSFNGYISQMYFWDSNNGLILALDTPNSDNGIWRMRNSGGAPCANTTVPFTGIDNKDIENNNLNEISFDLFPNPATNIIRIKTTHTGTFVIVDMLGQTVMSGNLGENENTLNISGLVAGMYIMKIGDESRKWIKRN